MKRKRILAALSDCLRKNRFLLILWLLFNVLTFSVFRLYRIRMEPFYYSGSLCTAVLLIGLTVDFSVSLRHTAERDRILSAPFIKWRELPPPASLPEKDYQDMLRRIGEHTDMLLNRYEEEKTDMTDYYTAWVHQIKTPISVMRMLLAGKDTPENRALSSELFRIEQYAEMVLQYIRLESGSSDLVIGEQDLDAVIRQTIRKYASAFIARGLYLHYEGTGISVVTDGKWLSCILEQLLSNAVKYTPSGGVTVTVSENGILQISDTGIGIAPCDLPRIFEKGYTGQNGRLEERASGIGLYLCKKAADKLSIPLSAESSLGAGSTFTLDLRQKQ